MVAEWYILIFLSPYPLQHFLTLPSCSVPTFANTAEDTCRNCSKVLKLFINPRVIGNLLDETGCLASSKLLWSERAWEQLFGRPVEEVTKKTSEFFRLFEQRALFMRFHLVVGWSGEVGRLAVLGMRE